MSYVIRGQSGDAFTSSPPAVLPYINNVQVSATGASSLYDLASVEGLKRPQGTLFGRNASAAVLFNTVAPSSVYGGYLDVRYGTYGTREEQGAVDVLIVSDKVLLRLAAGDISSRTAIDTTCSVRSGLPKWSVNRAGQR